ncbi:MmgE/PrpD family protein [Bordetella sp. 02P26C-1]|uniref:MmgE/PrpD family protein n=1 Tax=Bordetella sp. 02P26C-1 TaxID=2683195 RepID=UPI00135286AE|nr:MmgE/PrpD family protein [Bordetella sp. 02P26C-1]MVW77525.1 MmgE/PrpD family protein [Bordetella sp. 02P26C-1]
MKDHADTPATLALSETLAQFAANFDAASIPVTARERGRLLMLDSIGIALASHGYEFSRRALAAIGELDSGGDSIVIGSGKRMDPRNAAIANGVLIHGLDYDDTHARGVIHATASILPTVLALAARDDRSGSDMVAAYVLGMEAATRLGAVAKGGFHQVGFHPTGLIGTFGCTLAAGWLLGLNARQMVDAQGIALSLAAGSLEFLNDGAWNKRLHPGWAANAGITAATFGKHGYTGTRLAYEGRFGLYASHLGERDYDLQLATAQLGTLWEVERVSVKPLPACHFTHAAIDAAARLHAQGVRADQIRRITVLVPAEVVKTVCEPEASKRKPANSYEAQFSIPYLVSTALCKGKLTLDDLEEAALSDPAVLALAAITDYEHDPDSDFPLHYGGEVIVELTDGRKLREREAINRGAEDRPLTAADIQAKFRDNALRQISAERAAAIEQAVLGLEQGTARALADQLTQH